MFFGFGLSAWIGRDYVGAKIVGLPRLSLPGLSNLPILYGSLLSFDPLIYLVLPTAVLVWWVLFRTRWGLSLRAVGEGAGYGLRRREEPRPDSLSGFARSSDFSPEVGAAHLSIAYAMNWTEYMTAGRGFIAIALVIFSKWHPLRAIVGALLFSGAVAFQLLLQSSGIQVSPFLLNTVPYLLTLLVLIGWGGRRKYAAPASLGRVYQGTE